MPTKVSGALAVRGFQLKSNHPSKMLIRTLDRKHQMDVGEMAWVLGGMSIATTNMSERLQTLICAWRTDELYNQVQRFEDRYLGYYRLLT